MVEPFIHDWRDSLVLSSTASRAGRATELFRAVHAGRFRRLVEGVYLPADVWASLDGDTRYLAVIQAVALASARDLVFSHHSAAALWGLPAVRRWPDLPEVTVGRSPGGETRVAFTARKYPLPDDIDSVSGLRVTSLPRTCIDIARVAPLSCSVPMLDAALAGRTVTGVAVQRTALEAEYARTAGRRGMARCRTAIDLADGRSGSAGESLSRVGMHLSGLPQPILQQQFTDGEGLIGFTDFWWPEFNLIGEFDGRGKYLREDMLDGRTTADALLAEKAREDRLRALSLGVARWGWNTAASPELLGAHLRRAGLRAP